MRARVNSSRELLPYTRLGLRAPSSITLAEIDAHAWVEKGGHTNAPRVRRVTTGTPISKASTLVVVPE